MRGDWKRRKRRNAKEEYESVGKRMKLYISLCTIRNGVTLLGCRWTHDKVDDFPVVSEGWQGQNPGTSLAHRGGSGKAWEWTRCDEYAVCRTR